MINEKTRLRRRVFLCRLWSLVKGRDKKTKGNLFNQGQANPLIIGSGSGVKAAINPLEQLLVGDELLVYHDFKIG